MLQTGSTTITKRVNKSHRETSVLASVLFLEDEALAEGSVFEPV